MVAAAHGDRHPVRFFVINFVAISLQRHYFIINLKTKKA
jgi:hypothetical protein